MGTRCLGKWQCGSPLFQSWVISSLLPPHFGVGLGFTGGPGSPGTAEHLRPEDPNHGGWGVEGNGTAVLQRGTEIPPSPFLSPGRTPLGSGHSASSPCPAAGPLWRMAGAGGLRGEKHPMSHSWKRSWNLGGLVTGDRSGHQYVPLLAGW
jgi:hypothetical protein